MRRHILPNVMNLIVANAVLDIRRRRPHRDDPLVHRPGRPVRAVVGPDPRLRPRRPARRASGRGGTSRRRRSASSSWSSRSPSSATPSTTSSTPSRRRAMTTRADRREPRRRADESRTSRRATTRLARSSAERRTRPRPRRVRRRRQWPLPKQAVPGRRCSSSRPATHFKLERAGQGGRRRQLHVSTTARRWGSPASPAAARRRPRSRSCGSCRRTRRSSRAASSCSASTSCPRPRSSCGAIAGARSAIVFQGAMNALNPVRRVGEQIAEPHRACGSASREDAPASAPASCSSWSGSRASAAPPTRTSCPAGCASGR